MHQQVRRLTTLAAMAVLNQLDPVGFQHVVAEVAAALDESSTALDSLSWDTRSDAEPPEGGPGTDLARWAATFAVASTGARTFQDLAVAVSSTGPPASSGGDVLALLFGGLCDELRNADQFDAQRFALGVELAAERLVARGEPSGRARVGTVNAVAVAASEAALSSLDAGGDLADVLIEASAHGLIELERGPRENPELVDRGAVDPLAAGVLVVLDVLCGFVTGEPASIGPSDADSMEHDASASASGHWYEVSCRVEPHPGGGIEEADWLVATWYGLGDVVSFDPVEGSWPATVRSPLPGSVVEAIYDVGRPRELRITVVEPGEET